MREVHRRKSKKTQFKEIILHHIYENAKAYVIIIILFIIGIVAGIFFINNANESQASEIQSYITGFIDSLKQGYYIDKAELLKKSLWDNLTLIITMWFIGSTVIGIPIIFGIVAFRGFCIGYTVSGIIASLGVQKGIIFLLSTVLLQNLIFIPVIICMAVSCIRLYKSIMKDRRRENIKIEIIRHTLISVVLIICLVIASLVETYISTNILEMCMGIL